MNRNAIATAYDERAVAEQSRRHQRVAAAALDDVKSREQQHARRQRRPSDLGEVQPALGALHEREHEQRDAGGRASARRAGRSCGRVSRGGIGLDQAEREDQRRRRRAGH